MMQDKDKPGWSFYLLWILLTPACFPIAFLLGMLTLRAIIVFTGEFIIVDGVRHITEDYLALRAFAPVVAVLTGTVQYALLRRHLPRMGWWIAATTGGWLLGMCLILLPGWLHLASALPGIGVAFLVMGISIGAAQWLVLRRHLPGAAWWIAANVAGWGLLALTTSGNSMDQFGLLRMGLFPALLTALALAVLINRAEPTKGRAA